jgi:charged multivesicular body protein 7
MSELIHFILDHEAGFTKNRLASLYADFARDARLNPDNFAANSSDWRKALYHAARAGRIPSAGGATSNLFSPGRRKDATRTGSAGDNADTMSLATGEALLKSLDISPWGRPMALGAVIQDAINRGELIPYDEFVNKRESIYARSWISVPTPLQVVSWGLRQIGVVKPDTCEVMKAGRFVCVENLEASTLLYSHVLCSEHSSNPLNCRPQHQQSKTASTTSTSLPHLESNPKPHSPAPYALISKPPLRPPTSASYSHT